MSTAHTTRAVLRQSRLVLRRNNFRQASTVSDAASKAQETGKQTVSKASEGLTKVQSSAGSAVSRVGSSAYNALQRPLINVFRNPRAIGSSASSLMNSVNPESFLSSVRNVNSRQMTTVGIVFAEVLGFFTVGEMLGRLKLVGYHGEPHHEH
ncbi:ATP synthase subunit G atp20 [Elasticomyces elasticus]|nr:ATP synthase subunit G atp20 [Elasticomyces elasticus]